MERISFNDWTVTDREGRCSIGTALECCGFGLGNNRTLAESSVHPDRPVRQGRPKTYTNRLFLKALVIMILRRLPRVHRLLAVLAEPIPETQYLRRVLTENGRYPTRRTFERRLKAIPDTLPAQIGCLGRHLLALIDRWCEGGSAAAVDSTPSRARGGVWHQKHRATGEVPHTSIDTDAHRTKSGWHGWVYGGSCTRPRRSWRSGSPSRPT